jgi:N-acetylmuramoyl-L-alanine amidase
MPIQTIRLTVLLWIISLFIAVFFSFKEYDKKYRLKTIVLDAGHGGKDPGTHGKKTKEKDVVLSVVQKLGKLIKAWYPDIKVIYTRTTDKFIELNERSEIANRNNADLFISIHCNSGPAHICGSETYAMGLHTSDGNLRVAKRENAVILKDRNHLEVTDLVRYAIKQGIDISFIEEMPLGIVEQHNRAEAYYSSDQIKADLAKEFSLHHTETKTGGPSDYFHVAGTTTNVGFISPHSHNFCGSCNRVRLTVEGRLLLCLGNEHSIDLKQLMRSADYKVADLKQAIIDAMLIKPERHEFNLHEQPVIMRYMNMTGG